jgi:hypothetical protein
MVANNPLALTLIKVSTGLSKAIKNSLEPFKTKWHKDPTLRQIKRPLEKRPM